MYFKMNNHLFSSFQIICKNNFKYVVIPGDGINCPWNCTGVFNNFWTSVLGRLYWAVIYPKEVKIGDNAKA
jgi:hypothetical protein